MTILNSMIDDLGLQAFGKSRTDAMAEKVCVCCHKPVLTADGSFDRDLIQTPAGEREYRISGICEKCFDALFEE